MERVVQVKLSRLAEKQLEKLPKHIKKLFYIWITSLEENGMNTTRKISSYHDEPLKGNRYGQRSVRLNRAFRIIYSETPEGNILLIVIIEVNKHEY